MLASSEGLVLSKGKWVEVDREKLSEVLHHWRDVQEQAATGGVSFAEAMRMLAGADLNSTSDGEVTDARPEWSEVVAGKWLTGKLDSLRSPQIRSEIELGAGLRGELRPYQKTGVQWLWSLRSLGLGGCLADDMGLGKTIQVLGVLSMLRRTKATGTDLLSYTELAACPIAHVMMYMGGYRDASLHRYAGDLAAGLAFASFWQDIRTDLEHGRIYVPGEDLRHFDVTEDDLRAGRATASTNALIRYEVARTRASTETFDQPIV